MDAECERLARPRSPFVVCAAGVLRANQPLPLAISRQMEDSRPACLDSGTFGSGRKAPPPTYRQAAGSCVSFLTSGRPRGALLTS